MLGRLASLAVIGTFACTLACSGDDDVGPPDAMPPSPSCLEAPNHSDINWIQEEIFTPSCAAFSACHRGAANSAGGLNLDVGVAETNMVGVDSQLQPSMKLVVAGDSANSYLMVILGQFGTDDPRIDPSVGTMPYNNPVLCQPKIDAIGRWIDSL